MDIAVNAEVLCADGAVGHSRGVILREEASEVTHIIVRESGLFGVERLVPIDLITESTPETIHLRITKAEITEQTPFEQTEYIAAPLGPGGGATMFWPYPEAIYDQVPVTAEVIPEGKSVLHKGAHVHAGHDHVGKVEDLLIDPNTNQITHVVVRKGGLWGQKDVTVSHDQIAKIEDDTVYLRITAEQFEALPETSTNRDQVAL